MEARRLQREYQPKIKLLVGMEADWIRPQSKEFFEDLLEKYQFDLFVGSVHHVHTIPIDYNQDMYVKAREKSGGTDEGLFEDYFDLQLDMLRIMRPPIVGHFDLIRLLSDNKDVTLSRFGGVWRKILRNLDFISHYGGVVELNSAALRKGMVEPYPQMEICKVCHNLEYYITMQHLKADQAFAARGGHFTLSDDSHCTGHVGTHYAELMHFVERAGNLHIVVFEKGAQTKDSRFPGVSSGTISLANIQGHSVFN